MKAIKLFGAVLVISLIAALWYQGTYPGKWERLRYPLEYKDLIRNASKTYNIDPYLLTAIIYEESKFNPSSESKPGAIGLMQIMPGTGQWIAEKQKRRFKVDDLYGPAVNIDMGSWYFNYLREKYQDERLALAAYNSGHANVDKWLKDDRHTTVDSVIANIPYIETRQFVQRVLKTKGRYERLYPGEFKEPSGP